MKHISDHIKAVFFDHDDTLVGTYRSKSAHHIYVAKMYYDKVLNEEEIRQHWGKPLRELVCLLYGTDDVDEAMRNNTACHEDFPKELFTATIPTLRRIKEQGRLIGIVTATSRFSFEHDLKLHNVPKELIDYKQSADDTDYHKPDPRVFEPALAWLSSQGIKPGEVLYVGDGLHDMKAAIGAGFNFIGVETGLVTADEFTSAGGNSVPTVADLIK